MDLRRHFIEVIFYVVDLKVLDVFLLSIGIIEIRGRG